MPLDKTKIKSISDEYHRDADSAAGLGKKAAKIIAPVESVNKGYAVGALLNELALSSENEAEIDSLLGQSISYYLTERVRQHLYMVDEVLAYLKKHHPSKNTVLSLVDPGRSYSVWYESSGDRDVIIATCHYTPWFIRLRDDNTTLFIRETDGDFEKLIARTCMPHYLRYGAGKSLSAYRKSGFQPSYVCEGYVFDYQDTLGRASIAAVGPPFTGGDHLPETNAALRLLRCIHSEITERKENERSLD